MICWWHAPPAKSFACSLSPSEGQGLRAAVASMEASV